MKNAKFRFILFVLIAFFVGYYFGITKINLDWKNYRLSFNIVNRQPPQGVENIDFLPFWTAWQSLVNKYYDKTKLDSKKLLDGAISGLVQSIGDPYTIYLPAPSNTDFKQGLAGQFQGIGAELGMKDKKIIVVAPLSGSPAEKQGVRAGDIILKVDGASTEGWGLSQAVGKIRGKEGTQVTLTILHKGAKASQDITITRGVITVKSVDGFLKKVKDIEGIQLNETLKAHADHKIIYIRLSQFGDSTNKDWLTLVNSLALKSQKDQSTRGVILDLRNNPGGYLTDATFIAGEFLKEGKIVVTEETGSGEKTSLSVSRRGLFVDTPLVVLINKGSASASEIVSGAIKDYRRGLLVGENSFGKGTIQEAEDLGNGAGLHITIAKWLTPSGIWVNGKGLIPDVPVSADAKDLSHDTQLERAIEELVK